MVIPVIIQGLRIAATTAIVPITKKVVVPVGKVALRSTGKALQSFSNLPFGKQVAVTVGGTVAAGALTSSPKLREGVLSTPQSLYSLGRGVGESVEGKTLQPLREAISENPVASSIIGAGLVITAAGTIVKSAPLVSSLITQKSIRDTADTLGKAPSLSLPKPESYIPPVITSTPEKAPKLTTPAEGPVSPITVTGGPNVPVKTSPKKRKLKVREQPRQIYNHKTQVLNNIVIRNLQRW